jgi:hypothetical protein
MIFGRFDARLELDKLAMGQNCLLVLRLIPVRLVPRILLSSLRVQAALRGTNGRKFGDFPKKKEPLVWKSESIEEENTFACTFFMGGGAFISYRRYLV